MCNVVKCIRYQCEVYGLDYCPYLDHCDVDCPYYDGVCDTCIFENFDGTCGRDSYDDTNCW